ncbi:dihydrodipicolinate synthase family protein [Candidatus Solincola tengchongensis]|uniref:dihydrodipicolinate synthase family protein n=1 Tax=Candidatus Solincola tengchongensis TaxID=2900693 RepID=UPI00257BABB1|nr:dihydrodipicolinate synthase family protein [Candidatus Solincola tengchongensis]
MRRFEGIFAVMLTAYDEAGEIDARAMRHMTDYLIQSGVHGLVVLGSNGECPYIDHRRRKNAVDSVVEACAGRVPVIVGINERGLDSALDMATYAEDAGADGLLVALHRFYPLDEEAVLGFYRRLAEGTSLPILYYNFPTHTGLALSPQAIARIAAEVPSVVGAKETIFDVEEVRQLVEAAGEGFSVFTGMSFNLKATMEAGACGAICPLPNFVPRLVLDLYEACRGGDGERAEALQNEVYTYAPLLASSPTPHAMQKEALRLMGHPVSAAVKSPLPPLTPEQAEAVREFLASKGMV